MPAGDVLPSVYDEPPPNSQTMRSDRLTRGGRGGRPAVGGDDDSYSPPLHKRARGEVYNSYPLGGEYSRYFAPPVQNIGDDDILPEPDTLNSVIVQNQRESERQVIRHRLRVAERTKRAVLGSRGQGGLTTNATESHPWAGRSDLEMI